MRRCMGWMRLSTLRSRWSCDVRTFGDVLFPGGSRWVSSGYFSMTWMNRAMFMPVRQDEYSIGSRKPWLKTLFLGLGEVVR